jgi:SAM-dependent methyltransferase
MFTKVKYMLARRKVLQTTLDLDRDFETWEETCVPSYAHPNLLAAWTSWTRLFEAASLAKQLLPTTARVLDFGAGIAELKSILPESMHYSFIEELDTSVNWIKQHHPEAVHASLDDGIVGYDAIFALDSLEHNDDYQALVLQLIDKLNEDGILIVSGPTENWLYRLGRRIAGFSGHYHMVNIHSIDKFIDEQMELVDRNTVPFAIPLFIISAWKRRGTKTG